MKLAKDFYLGEDVVRIAKELLGKVLVTNSAEGITSGIIAETEANMAPEDKASHAWNGKRTARTEVFYKEGGRSYVYLCYGIHNLFNIVTNVAEVPHAILVRAVEPLEGLNLMLERRNKILADYALTSGPGSMSIALGISRKHNDLDITGEEIWVEDRGIVVPESSIASAPRIGVAYAEEWAAKPFRFYIKENKWVSKPR